MGSVIGAGHFYFARLLMEGTAIVLPIIRLAIILFLEEVS